MVYGFAARVWKNDKKLLKLPTDYGEWIKKFAYPEKNAVIRTLNGKIFEVKVFNLTGDYFLYNGWLDVVTSLKLSDNSWVVFKYEEALTSFRLFHFYQDISHAPSNYFYYKAGHVKDRDDSMKEMSITDDHLLVLEMVDFNTFDLSVFSCKPALLTFPPELCVIKKKEQTDELMSDDDMPNPIAEPVIKQSDDDEVPVTFVVDNHFRLKKKWAHTHGLDGFDHQGWRRSNLGRGCW
ncbi:putative DNA-binding pseudobarrel domain superfamily [Helianthus annuus]|nr:putative DNA-binding pseudobarrel domain superfamily [Helianthus annuus]